jgi:hypothetical protein
MVKTGSLSAPFKRIKANGIYVIVPADFLKLSRKLIPFLNGKIIGFFAAYRYNYKGLFQNKIKGKRRNGQERLNTSRIELPG